MNHVERMERILRSPRVGIDTETNGLDWKVHKVVGVSVANDEESVYCPIRHDSGNCDQDAVYDLLERHKDKLFFAHNAKFDLHMFMNDEYRPEHVHCTQVMAALLDENRITYKLGDLAKELLDKEKLDIDVKNIHHLDGFSDKVQTYASRDAELALELSYHFEPLLEKEALQRVWEMEKRLTYTLMRMERRGVPVDEARLHEFQKEAEEALRQASLEIGNINTESSKQVKEYLESVGVENFNYTDKGNVKMDRAFLESIPEGEPIIRARRYRKTLDSFCKPLKERHIWKGKVHTNFNQVRSEDGNRGTIVRLSSNNPNLQQVPKRDKMIAKPFRKCFIAPKGQIWVKGDYNQQEYRMFASYSGSKQLIEGYSQDPPMDMHQVVANLLGVERDPTAKRMNMGMLNNMGDKTLAESLGCDLITAQRHLSTYHMQLPEVSMFNKRAQQIARSRRYVRTMLGRRMRFPNGWWSHRAPSRIIQGSSADLTKLKMVEVDDYFRANGNVCTLILSVHDELDWLAEDSPRGRQQSQEAIRIMESIDGLDNILKVKMKVDAGEGKDWGEASFD